jgi:hypothetical protein
MSALLLLGLGAVALVLRLAPAWIAGPTFGGDRWYWRAYVDELRQERRLPPRLPRYLLDAGHWYPPVFPLLLAALPEGWLEKRDALAAVALDLLRFALVLVALGPLTGTANLALVAAGLAYATAPVLVSYNSQLNPRGLGALLLDAGVLSALHWWSSGSLWGLALALACGAAVLLVHKMTTQVMWFLCVAAALWLESPGLALLVPGSMLLAWLVSGGFYWKVLRAHWDIVRFWNRNWRWLFCHPLADSPIYGADASNAVRGLHGGGLDGIIRRLVGLLGMGPAAWTAMAAAGVLASSGSGVRESGFALGWLVLVLVFAVATTFVPPLRGLGAGYLYLYNAAFPAALAWGTLAARSTGRPLGLLWGAGILAGLIAIAAFYRRLSRLAGQAEETALAALIEYLRQKPRGRILCVPQRVSDALAYQTEHDVVWGGHGYGFGNLEPLFPRWLIRLDEVLERYRVDYLLVEDRGEIPERFEQELGALSPIGTFDAYRLYSPRRGEPEETAVPATAL